jgi:leader peptidase (prepilin peptidase)/N-methyltransferase
MPLAGAFAGAFVGGSIYAALLWFIAGRVALRRDITLGALPPWMLALAGCAAAGAALIAPAAVAFPAGATLVGALVCGLVDARTGFIFNALTLTMAAVAGLAAATNVHPADGMLAAAIVGAGLGALHLLTGRRGIGLGDVKLGSAIALGYGVGPAVVAIGSAFILGALYAVTMIGLGRAKRTDALRFGPFIAGGAVVGLSVFALGPLV